MYTDKQFYWFGWIRFCAALIVVFAHARHLVFAKYADLEQSNLITALFYAVTKLGNEAVLVFFVLSGFLVGGRAIERLRENSFDLRQYSIDRVTRIYLPLIPAILFTVIVDLWLKESVPLGHVLGNMASLQGIVVPQLEGNEALWSLSYEVWFYISMAAVALIYGRHLVGWVLLVVVIYVFTELSPHYLLCWFLGAAAYLYRPKKSYGLLLFGSCLVLYGCIGRQLGRGSESVDLQFLEMFVLSLEVSQVVFSAGIALLLQQVAHWRKYEKVSYIGDKFADFSYTLYLIHFPVIHLFTSHRGLNLSRMDMDSIGCFLLIVLSALGVAYAMYWVFEKRTNWVRRFIAQRLCP